MVASEVSINRPLHSSNVRWAVRQWNLELSQLKVKRAVRAKRLGTEARDPAQDERVRCDSPGVAGGRGIRTLCYTTPTVP